MKKTYLKDLAEAAGVSISQASRALNGKPEVAPEVRRRVHELARQMNYRNLSYRHPVTIAILNDWIEEFNRNLLNELLRAARKRKIRFSVIPPEHISLLDEWLFDGAITLGRGLIPDWHERFGLPLAAINSYGNLLDRIPGVYPEGGGDLAVEHLFNLGHRRIALLQHDTSDKESSRDRQRGMTEFQRIAKKWGIEEEARHRFHTFENLEEVVRELLEEGFTAFIGVSSAHGPSLYSALCRCGKRIPEDASVIATETEYISPSLMPPLTTIAYDYPALARNAIDLLLAEINGGSELRSIACPSKFIVRGSTGPCPSS